MSDDPIFRARTLRADWLNGWLAAIGVAVLVEGVRLSWSDDPVPYARFHRPPPGDLPALIADALPTRDDLDQSAIARSPGWSSQEFPRNVPLDAYRERAHAARLRHDPSLGMTVTDCVLRSGAVAIEHGAFDPPVPRGVTLLERALSCRREIDGGDPRGAIERSLTTGGPRAGINGLGFCARRLGSGVQAGSAGGTSVDPVVELLVYCALPLFPVRGDGVRARQRQWFDRSTQRGALAWGAWHQPLDVWAIDSLLDQQDLCTGPRWQVVPFRPSGSADKTRAYFSEASP